MRLLFAFRQRQLYIPRNVGAAGLVGCVAQHTASQSALNETHIKLRINQIGDVFVLAGGGTSPTSRIPFVRASL